MTMYPAICPIARNHNKHGPPEPDPAENQRGLNTLSDWAGMMGGRDHEGTEKTA